MTEKKNQTFYTKTWINYIAMKCPFSFEQVDSNGYILKKLTWINILAIECPKELSELHND